MNMDKINIMDLWLEKKLKEKTNNGEPDIMIITIMVKIEDINLVIIMIETNGTIGTNKEIDTNTNMTSTEIK